MHNMKEYESVEFHASLTLATEVNGQHRCPLAHAEQLAGPSEEEAG